MAPFHRDPPAHLQARLGIAIALAIAGALLLMVLQFLLPWLLLGAAILGGLGLWQRQHQQQQLLYAIFYDHLRHNQGRLSVLEFAMAAQIPGPQARSFLDARARDFLAQFEPTHYGDVVYTFDLPNNRPEQQSSL